MVGDNIKLSAISNKMKPGELKNHLNFNAWRLKSWAALREDLRTYFTSRRTWTSATEMEMDAVEWKGGGGGGGKNRIGGGKGD